MQVFRATPAGLRRKVVTLLSRNAGQDEFGQATGYTPYLTTHAFVETLQAGVIFRSGSFTSEVSHRVNIRYAPSINVKSKDRVTLITNGVTRTFDIKAISNPNERNIELDLFCLELGDGAGAGA